MKINKPENENYAATVVKLVNIIPLENCDNVVGSTIFGNQAIIGKDYKIGDIGIVFPAETQLSEEFCKLNNLYRHSELNKDKNAVGYIEDNRRVKAMKFRGHRSSALFMPLSSLNWTKANIDELQEGDTFDELNGKSVCRKYLIRRKVARVEKNKAKVFKRVDEKFLPEHYDTENFFRNHHVVNPEREVIVTQKLHGTSIRIGNTFVKRQPKLHEKIAGKLGVKVKDTELDYVFGSRKVIKDVNNPNQNHYYSTDIWTDEGKKLEGLVPEQFLVYGELIGWTPEGGAIQQNYTYKVPHGTCDLYIYRIAHVNTQGRVTDLTWDQVKEFCRDAGLRHVPELWRGKMSELTKVISKKTGQLAIEKMFLDKRFAGSGYPQAVPLEDDKKLVDEGVCVRVDGLAPYILKAKSPLFLEHESKMLDKEAVDLEAEGSIADA